MQQISDTLFTSSLPMKVASMDIRTRTSVVRRGDGGLIVHQPGPLDDAFRGELEQLGTVRALIAPNNFHHLFLKKWRAAFPEAELHVSAGIPNKQKSLSVTGVLGTHAPDVVGDALTGHSMEGFYGFAGRFDEMVFHHAPSRTLIVSDLIFNLPEKMGFMGWLMDTRGRGTTRLLRAHMKDKPAIRRSIDHVATLDFDRVILAHGEVIESGGKAALLSAYERLC